MLPSEIVKLSKKELAFIYACAEKYESEKRNAYDKL